MFLQSPPDSLTLDSHIPTRPTCVDRFLARHTGSDVNVVLGDATGTGFTVGVHGTVSVSVQ